MTLVDLLVTAQAFASEAAGAEHHAPSINDIWFPLANFLIYAFIIVKFAVPPIRDFLKSRRAEVVTTLEQSSAKMRAAEALVNEYRAKLSAVDNEIQSIRASLRDDGEREKTKLVSEAQATAAKIRQDADFLADQEVKMARQQLREEMAAEAESAARQLVTRNLTGADQNRLVDDFIQTIGSSR